jgi:CRP/FNR family transcriptional regulator, cyclic AMP receptor protein
MTDLAESLREIPLFAELSDRDRRQLAAEMHEKSYSPGQEVVVEGEAGVGFFVVLDGSARVTVRGQDHGTLRAGDYFGEMALVDGSQRSASVTADDGLRCAGITMWNFRPFVRDHPDVAWALLKALVKRVRAAEERSAPAA